MYTFDEHIVLGNAQERLHCMLINGLKSDYKIYWAGGLAAKYLRAFSINAGIGGGVGKWLPEGWKPFSSATYVTRIGVPSGDTYENSPVAA